MLERENATRQCQLEKTDCAYYQPRRSTAPLETEKGSTLRAALYAVRSHIRPERKK